MNLAEVWPVGHHAFTWPKHTYINLSNRLVNLDSELQTSVIFEA